jgi:transcriptional regulator with XRE-family HTH domain
MDPGGSIRKLRKRMGLTLQAVADRCGFTRSLLCKIETGRTAPPVATLARIAEALGVKVASLLDGAGRSGTIHQDDAVVRRGPLVRTDAGYSYFAFAGERGDKLMQPFLFEVAKGQVRPHKLTHTGEEFVYMLEGEVRYRVGRVEYRLGPGDSLYFDAENEHEVTPLTARARYLAVFVDPPQAAKLGGGKRKKAD